MRSALLMMFVALALPACGGLRSHLGDGGQDAGPGNQGDAGGSDSGNGGDGGADGGGDGGTDGGTSARGLTWTQMNALQANQFDAIAGVGSGTSVILYASHETGRIDRFQSGAWQTVYTDSFNTDFLGLWVSPSDEVFAGGSTELISCTSNCSVSTSYQSFQVPTFSTAAVCGQDRQHAYAVGSHTSTLPAMYQYDAGMGGWDEIPISSAWSGFAGCWVDPTGTVFIAAQSQVIRYDAIGFTAETVNWPGSFTANQIANEFFHGVSGNGAAVYAAGDHHLIISRQPNGTWNVVFNAADPNAFNAIAMDSDGGGIAGGIGDTFGPYVTDALFSDGGWGFDSAPPSLTVLGAWAASPNEYYLAGGDVNTINGLIFRGTR